MQLLKKYKDDKKYAVAIGRKKPRHPDDEPPGWFKAFAAKQEEFNKSVTTFINDQKEFNKNQLAFNQMVIEQFNKHGW